MSAQLALADWIPPTGAARVARAPEGPTHLRPYQQDAVEAIFRHLGHHRSTLLVLPTGAGKTTVFGEVARLSYPQRVLVIAHREELLDQARARLREMTRGFVGLEQGKYWSNGERVVVGSVQSVGRAGRLGRFRDDPPDLIIVDEAHHAVANSYRAILDAFPDAKVLGVTATAIRADGSALEQVFQSVAYRQEITECMDLGYLVPLWARQVELVEADLTFVKTTAGDFNLAQLDEQMTKECACIAEKTLALAGTEEKGIVFSTTVQTAHDLVEYFNGEAGRRIAVAVDGAMHSDDRRRRLQEHADPDSGVNVLINVGIATEGYDCPLVSYVAVARPTKSWGLYAQMVGRCLRVLKGLVEGEPDQAKRHALVAASRKSRALVLDFSPTAGKHKLIGPEDLLGGSNDCDEAVKAAAREAMRNSMMDVREAMRLAAELVEADRRVRAAVIGGVRVKVKANVRDLDLVGAGEQSYSTAAPLLYANRKQVDHLVQRFGWDQAEARSLTMAEATRHTRRGYLRKSKGLATHRQERKLEQYGIQGADTFSFKAASAVLDQLAKQQWRALAPSEIHTIVRNADRKPGEEG